MWRIDRLESADATFGKVTDFTPDTIRKLIQAGQIDARISTRKYIRDFNSLNHQTTTILDLYGKMLAMYPDRANPGSLWSSARAVKQ